MSVITMAHYLVTALPKTERLNDLFARLAAGEFVALKPFGEALSYSLNNARVRPNGKAIWEEEDYCRPPLAQERAAVLDAYFDGLEVKQVSEGEGWAQIQNHPPLFPELLEEKRKVDPVEDKSKSP